MTNLEVALVPAGEREPPAVSAASSFQFPACVTRLTFAPSRSMMKICGEPCRWT